MFTLRRFLYKPKKTDPALLSQFYFADEDLCAVAAELDSFDGRKNPARCAALVSRLRQYQDHVLGLIQSMMDEVIPGDRAVRDFRVKYPDDLVQDGLAGQLWFGAECLSAGSNILNRVAESVSMRPLAKSLTKQVDQLRQLLRDQCLRDPTIYTDRIKHAFIRFDRTFAEFELSYVSAMVPVKTMKEYDMAQEVTVLFSETVNRALAHSLITTSMLEYYDPALMFTIPRLAIVSGLVVYPCGPLNPQNKPKDLSEMFRPFQSLLHRIRELLWTLSHDELNQLERLLCNLEEAPVPVIRTNPGTQLADCSSLGDSHTRSVLDDSHQIPMTSHHLMDTVDEPGVARVFHQPIRQTSTASEHSIEFSFNLPANKSDGRQITISRTLSQDHSSQSGDSASTRRSTTDESSDSTDTDSTSSSDDVGWGTGDFILESLDKTSEAVRKKHGNTQDLIQKLFVCISGVADQLQTNFASDLRNILKAVFDLHTGSDTPKKEPAFPTPDRQSAPPTWMPDSEMSNCCSCKLPFTFVRRRHHCRNCGLIFCSRCSSNSAPLPNIGYEKAVRICNNCYIYRVDPFFADGVQNITLPQSSDDSSSSS